MASTAPGLAYLSSFRKYLFLDRHGLEHRLDDEVSILDVLDADHAVDQAHALGGRVRRNAAARRGRLVILLHHAHAALELFFAGLDQRHRNTGIGERHRDAAAHGAGADDGDALDIARLGALGHAGDLGGLALGKEGVALRLRLVARHQLEKTFALLLQPFVERQVDGGADRVGRGERGFQPARLLGERRDRVGEDRAVGLGGRELGVVVAQLAQRAFLGQHLAREGLAAGGRTFDDFLDQPVLERLLRADRIAADDHLDREFRTDRARQALGAAGARQQAEFDLGQAEPCVLGRDAEMAGERDLEAAAERRAVNGGNDRLRRVLHRAQHLVQARRHRRLAEFGDVGAGDKGAAAAGQNDRLHFRIGDRALDAFENAAADGGAQRVHRRAVDRDDGDDVMTLELDHFVHADLPGYFVLGYGLL